MRSRLSMSLATLAVVTMSAVGIVPAAHADSSASIAGSVSLPAGVTSQRVTITVYDATSGGEVAHTSTLTGAYSLNGLAAGDYRVAFDALDSAILDQWWQNAATWASSTTIALAEGQEAVGVSAALTRGASISGRVYFDPVEAGPSSGTTIIYAYPVGSDNYVNAASVKAGQTYTIGGLPAGDYQLRALSLTSGAINQWWDQTADRAGATVITITDGEQLGGLDITVQKEARLSGRIGLPSGLSFTDMTLKVGAYASNGSLVKSVPVEADGSFVIPGLHPGAYRFRVWDSASRNLIAGQYIGGASSLQSASAIELGSGEELSVDVELQKYLSLGTFPTMSGTFAVGRVVTAALSLAGTPAEGAAVSFTWLANGQQIPSAHDSTLLLDASLEGAAISVAATVDIDGYGTRTMTGSQSKKVIRTGQPEILGSFVVGSVVSVDPGDWTAAAGSYFYYTWYIGGSPRSGSDQLLLGPADVGQLIEVTVSSSSSSGYASVTEHTSGSVVAPATLSASVPTISGTPTVGQKLTAKLGTWTDGTSVSYRWLADGAVINGAESSTLDLGAAQFGRKIAVRVTGTKAGYTTISQTSATSSPVLGLLRTATPTISGTAAYGSTLTAKPGSWTSGTTLSYQWYANGTAIGGATKPTFKLGSAQKAKAITVKVTGMKSGYVAAATTSKPTPKIIAAGTPTISGTAKVGKTLTAKPGTWTSGTTFTYQWYASGKAIAKATKSKFKLTSSQKGKKVTVRVTGKKSGYATIAKTSAGKRAS